MPKKIIPDILLFMAVMINSEDNTINAHPITPNILRFPDSVFLFFDHGFEINPINKMA